MTQDEILEALHKVVAENTHYTTWTVSTPHLVLLVNLAIEQEREACAKVCEEMRTYVGRNNAVTQSSAQDCATAIRARGQA
jgi:bacteriorhodopsin